MKFAKLFTMCLMSLSMALYGCSDETGVVDDNDDNKPGTENPDDKNEPSTSGLTFRITVVMDDEDPGAAMISIIPSDRKATYYLGVIDKEGWTAEFGNDFNAIFARFLSNQDERYVKSGQYTWNDLLLTGSSTLPVAGLPGLTEFYVIVAGVEYNGTGIPVANSEIAYEEFETGEVEDYNWYILSSLSDKGDQVIEDSYDEAVAVYYDDYYEVGLCNWMIYLIKEGSDDMENNDMMAVEFLSTDYKEIEGEFRVEETVDAANAFPCALSGGFSYTYGFAGTFWYTVEDGQYTNYMTACGGDMKFTKLDDKKETGTVSVFRDPMPATFKNYELDIDLTDYYGSHIKTLYTGQVGFVDPMGIGAQFSNRVNAFHQKAALYKFSTFNRIATAEREITAKANPYVAR